MKFLRFLTMFCVSTIMWCQMEHPKASPYATIEQQVGLTNIRVSYSRPAAKGRVLFGYQSNGRPGLVPNDRIWRVGANESTKISFDTAVSIFDKDLEKGTYALYAFPSDSIWQIVFHTNLDHWGDGRKAYDPKEDALRVKAKPYKTLNFQENFSISFDHITHNTVHMMLSWGNTKIDIPIVVNTSKIMETQIQQKLNTNPTAQTYYEIARYYQEQAINSKQSLVYVNKALEMKGSTYYFHRVKSLILADLGDFKAAIKEAESSKVLAQKESKDEFVRLNENNILLWKRKLN